MKKLKFHILIASIALLSACASYPPPRFEDNLYINPKYEFTLGVPDGWERTTKIPDEFVAITPPGSMRGVKAVLKNRMSRGVIIIKPDKTILSLDLILLDSKASLKGIKNKYRRDGVKIQKRFKEIEFYSSEVYEPVPGMAAGEVLAMVIVEAGPITGIRKDYIYECHQDDMCMISILLITNNDFYDQNVAVLDEMISSIDVGPVEQ